MRRSWLGLLLLLTACPSETKPPDVAKPDPGPKTLTIFATGDVGSDTDVCGCKARQMGGVARRAHVIKTQAEGVAVVVDAGDLFFRNWTVAPRYEAQARATAQLHADLLKHFDAPAMAVGERDLALGLGTLRGLGERAGVKLLSANLRHTESGTAAFDAFTIAERGGVKIGFVGASPELPPKAQAHLVYQRAGLRAEPALAHVEAAARQAKKDGAQIVVALLHLTFANAQQILDTLEPGVIDLAVIAHDRTSRRLQLAREGRSAFLMPGDRGKWVAKVEIEVVPGATRVADMGAVQMQAEQIDKIAERIAAYAKDEAPKDPKAAADRAATVKRLEARKTALEKDLATVKTAKRHRLSGELVPLDRDLPEDEGVLAIYRRYQDHLGVVNHSELTARADMTYVGNASCAKCHADAFAHWKKTGHAKAWETMKRTRQTSNLDCVPCHVTGFDRPGGPRRLAELATFVDVGCESCHGPGSAHAKDPQVKVAYPRDVPERVCAECHRAQEDQKPFVYEDRLPKIVGRGHGAPAKGG